MLTFSVPENYGNVVALALGAIPFLGFIHGTVVTSLRKKAGVPYPHHYATVEQCKANPQANQFNCAQRAHGNFLENMPQTMITALVAGLQYPNAAAVATGVWVVSRFLYMYGYVYGGNPTGKGRYWGSGFWFAQWALGGMALMWAWPMVKVF